MSAGRHECPLCWSSARMTAQYLRDEGAHGHAEAVLEEAKAYSFKSWKQRAKHLRDEHGWNERT